MFVMFTVLLEDKFKVEELLTHSPKHNTSVL